MDVDQPWEKLNYPLDLFPTWEVKDDPVLLGIDEAGRGPTLGPMVYAAGFCRLADKEALANVGYMDSKDLKLHQREALFASLREAKKVSVGYVTRILTAEELSGRMLDLQRHNLNEISHMAAIEMIRRVIEAGYNVKEIYVDTVGPPHSYQAKLKNFFPGIDIVVSKRADSLYPIVSAASIVAKVTRDRILEGWIFEEDDSVVKDGRSWGSGYPGDARTRGWMKNNIDKVFGFPNVMRFSWKPCVQILESAAVSVDFGDDITEMDFEGGTPNNKKKTPSRRNSLSSTRAANQAKLHFGGPQRYRFFQLNEMEVVNDF
jgi:ribonuclease H2 subunit A